jgi:cation diffusion facilitator family transporter
MRHFGQGRGGGLIGRDYTCAVMQTRSGATVQTAIGNNEGRRGAGAEPGHDAIRRSRQIRRILAFVLVLNLLVAGAKLGYGFVSGSVAMTADGFNSFLDGFANVVGIVGIAVAARPPDEEHQYGHGRYETLATMGIGALMAVGVIEIVRSAIARWQAGEAPEVTQLSFGIMFATMAVNTVVTIWERRAARRLRSNLLQADSRHTASDVLVSAAVIIGLVGEHFGFQGADAIVSLFVAGMIGWAAWGILREATLVLTDAATDVDARSVLAAVESAPGVVTAHNLRLRSSGGQNWAEVHITVNPELTVREAHEVATGVEEAIRGEAGPETQATVHVEPAVPPHTRPDPLFGNEQRIESAPRH